MTERIWFSIVTDQFHSFYNKNAMERTFMPVCALSQNWANQEISIKVYYLDTGKVISTSHILLVAGEEIKTTFLFLNAITDLTLLHSERPKLYAILVFLSAAGLNKAKFIYT